MIAKVSDYETSDLAPRIKAALRFLDAWILGHGHTIDQALFDELAEHFSARQVVELTYLFGIYEMVHKANHAFEAKAPTECLYSYEKMPVPPRLQPAFDDLLTRRVTGNA